MLGIGGVDLDSGLFGTMVWTPLVENARALHIISSDSSVAMAWNLGAKSFGGGVCEGDLTSSGTAGLTAVSVADSTGPASHRGDANGVL